MAEVDVYDFDSIAFCLREQALKEALRISVHAHQEMVEEGISYVSLRETLLNGKVIENYPEHQRGSCCLVCGQDSEKRFLHVCCTTSHETAIIITVYEPKLPKWVTPYQRRK